MGPTFTPFLDDPISSADNDQINRQSFASELAKRLAGIRHDRSVTFAVTGDWGSGKTSLMNLVIEQIKGKYANNLRTCVFNPWQLINQEQLTVELFRTVEQGIISPKHKNESHLPSHLRSKRIADRFRKYAAALGVGTALSSIPHRVIGAFIISVVTIGLISISSLTNLLSSSVTALIMWLVTLAVLFMNFTGRLATAIALYFDAKAVIQNLTAAELKDGLVKGLRERKSQLVVFIDDIDRLTHSEIRLLFQLLKASLDLPYVTFVLFFQMSTVETALGDDSTSRQESGRQYLEKLVPIRYDLPPIPRSSLRSFIELHLSRLALEVTGKELDEGRWGHIYIQGVRQYIWNLRDAKRFLNTLSFHIEGFRKGLIFEANFVDVAALETLRVFEPRLYSQLRRYHDLLLGTARKDSNESIAANELLGYCSPANREAASRILGNLFPHWSKIYEFSTASYDEAALLRERRVSHKKMFDLYFSTVLEDAAISQSEIQRIVASTSSANKFLEVIRSMVNEGRFEGFIDILTAHTPQVRDNDVAAFVTALFTAADDFKDPYDYYKFAESIAIQRLSGIQDQDFKLIVLSQILENCSSIFALASFLARQAHADGNRKVIDKERLFHLQLIALQRIREVANTNLVNSPGLIQILYAWEGWSNLEEVQQWANSATSSRRGLITFLQGMIVSSMVYDGREYRQYYIQHTAVSRFVSSDVLEERITALDDLDHHEKQIVDMYLKKSDAFGD